MVPSLDNGVALAADTSPSSCNEYIHDLHISLFFALTMYGVNAHLSCSWPLSEVAVTSVQNTSPTSHPPIYSREYSFLKNFINKNERKPSVYL